MKKTLQLIILGLSISLQSVAQEETTKENAPGNDKSAIYWLYDAHYRLAIQYNDYSEAQSALYSLILLEPQNDSLRYNLAFMYFDGGQNPSAILVCNDILARNPSHLGALELSAAAFENLGIKDKALARYEKLYMASSDLNSLYKMAFLQFDLKKYAECKVNIDILLENKELQESKVVFTDENNQSKEYPMKVAVLNLKGLVNRDLGNKKLAQEAFEEVLATSPDFQLAKKNLEELLK